MFLLALKSLSCFSPHDGQVHSLMFNVKSWFIHPQLEHILEDGKNLSILTNCLVRKLKQESTYHIWRSQHRNYLYTQFWVEKTFWSDGYFICSIGEANPNTIKQYILTQG